MTGFSFGKVMEAEIKAEIDKSTIAVQQELEKSKAAMKTILDNVRAEAQKQTQDMQSQAANHKAEMTRTANEFQQEAQEKINTIDPRLQALEKANQKKDQIINDQAAKIQSLESKITGHNTTISAHSRQLTALEGWRKIVDDCNRGIRKIMGKLTGEDKTGTTGA